MSEVTAAITAENTFTDWIQPYQAQQAGHYEEGKLNVSIFGTFVATVTLQRTFDGGTVIRDVESFSAPTEEAVSDHESRVQYRIGVKSGDFTSGTVNVRLGA